MSFGAVAQAARSIHLGLTGITSSPSCVMFCVADQPPERRGNRTDSRQSAPVAMLSMLVEPSHNVHTPRSTWLICSAIHCATGDATPLPHIL